MEKVLYCTCDKCKRDIFVGETVTTYCIQKERIESESCVQPLEVNVTKTLCSDCE